MGVSPDKLHLAPLEAAAVVQGNCDILGPGYHVIVGEDITVRAKDNARTQAVTCLLAGHLSEELLCKLLEEGVVKGKTGNDNLPARADVNHRRQNLRHHSCKGTLRRPERGNCILLLSLGPGEDIKHTCDKQTENETRYRGRAYYHPNPFSRDLLHSLNLLLTNPIAAISTRGCICLTGPPPIILKIPMTCNPYLRLPELSSFFTAIFHPFLLKEQFSGYQFG
ncbi:hypothetical protein ES703_14100 [subsurface metagenome]